MFCVFCSIVLFCVLSANVYCITATRCQPNCNQQNISYIILEDTDTRASDIRGYFPQVLKYQDFWSIYSMLKEFYCIFEALLDVLKIELWIVIGDLDFPREHWFSC
jgi:hypothetical protein